MDLAAVAAEAVQAAEPAAAATGVSSRSRRTPRRSRAIARGSRSSLDNLVSNAVKFTSEGGSVTRRASGRPATRVSSRSPTPGMGIPAEEQEQLFERFFRSSNARRAAVPGTGLGLVIVRAIAEAHGGDVTVESEEGAGTTFRVSLPVREPESAGDDVAMQEVA